MNMANLYPLRFEPIYQYRLWGGRSLADLLSAPLPGDGPIGEAWVLSDRDDHQSLVADGPLKGKTIGQLMKQFPEQLLGASTRRYQRFPLLLKFLDARDMLSVQVHPSDAPEPRACRVRRGTSAVRGTVGNAESTLPATAPETVSSIDRWFCL